MKFLIDAQLPPGLAVWLTERGHEAVHAKDLMLLDAPDSAIWAYATTAQLVIVTKDEDFPARVKRTTTGPNVIWLRIGNSTNRSLFTWLEPRWPIVLQMLSEGNRLIEVR